MKFTCTQENLSSALNLITPITGKNLTLPILNNILVKLSKSDITFSSTNLEIAVVCRVRGKVEVPGDVTLNGKLFREFVSLQPNGNIVIEEKTNDLHITSGASKTVIKGAPVDEYPIIPTIENAKHTIKIAMPQFRNAMHAVLPTIAQNDSRPEISGMLMKITKTEATFVGTDSYRLAEYTLPLTSSSIDEGSFIIPLRTIQEVLRIFTGDTLTFVFTENQMLVQSEDVDLVSRLIEGAYPDYKEIIPTDEKTTISVNKEEFIQAVKTASLFCKAGVNDIELSTKKAEKLLVVVAANNQVGENISTLPAVITGDDITIVFNYRYVLDALSTMPTEEVLFSFGGPNNTGIMRPADQTAMVHLIMPLRQ